MEEENSYLQSQELEVLKSIFGEDSFSQIQIDNYSFNNNKSNNSGSSSSSGSENENEIESSCIKNKKQTTTTTTTTTTTSTTTINTDYKHFDYTDEEDDDEQLTNFKYTIKVKIDLPNKYKIIVFDEEKNKDLIYPILCLPSIKLGFIYPKGYPSKEPPILSLSSCWLKLEQMKLLLDKLYDQWESDELLMFKLVDWLKCNTIKYLGIQESLLLDKEPIDFQSDLWEQGVEWDHDADWISTLNSLPLLRSFNSHEGKKMFDQQYHVCLICDNEGCGQTEFTQLLNCSHYACNDCISSIVCINLNENEFSQIKCPEPDCNQMLDLSIVQKFFNDKNTLPPSTLPSTSIGGSSKKVEINTNKTNTPAINNIQESPLFKYESFLKQKKGLLKCTKCEDGWAYVDQLTRSTYCSTCYYSYCTLCRQQFHPGQSCDMKGTRDAQSSTLNLGVIRICPVCSALISKSEGCNKMKCISCCNTFCWICMKANIDYNHFGQQCELFQIGNSSMTRRNRRGTGNRATAGTVDASTLCRCKSIIYRFSGSNSVFCYNCDSRYCFLCKSKIKGTSHFMQTQCSQNGIPSTFKPDKTYKFFDLSSPTSTNIALPDGFDNNRKDYIFDGIVVKRN